MVGVICFRVDVVNCDNREPTADKFGGMIGQAPPKKIYSPSLGVRFLLQRQIVCRFLCGLCRCDAVSIVEFDLISGEACHRCFAAPVVLDKVNIASDSLAK